MRSLALPVLLAGALISLGCYDFHQPGPEDPDPVVRPSLVDVTIEYRQPRICTASSDCGNPVVFFPSWLPIVQDPQGRPTGGSMVLQRITASVWRGVAHDVPVNYPPKDDPHVVAVYDPYLRDTETGGITAGRLLVGREALTVFVNAGTPQESAFVYIDENGFGHNPF